MLACRVVGSLKGNSVMYAVRRRRSASGVVKKIAKQHHCLGSVVFAVDDAVSRLESAILAASNTVLGGAASGVSVNVASGGASISVTTTECGSEADDLIRRLVMPLFGQNKPPFKQLSIIFPQTDESLSDLQLLRLVKREAPCDADELAIALRCDKMNVEVMWLKRRMDVLRKRDLLTHIGDGSHVLTLQGLRAIPTSNRRDSSDIERALAFKRKGW